ncbi:hypothetical protein FGO68_gene13893 [Halteria grandinella]|uniref:Uncharacterized protein n=1 Tax=Halteria grandinella TaxID=5974 RepID=A0A8J8P2P3_HALGN|nr:hypothetical protein FGO68_gene13893 [Halteria grandinella]
MLSTFSDCKQDFMLMKTSHKFLLRVYCAPFSFFFSWMSLNFPIESPEQALVDLLTEDPESRAYQYSVNIVSFWTNIATRCLAISWSTICPCSFRLRNSAISLLINEKHFVLTSIIMTPVGKRFIVPLNVDFSSRV